MKNPLDVTGPGRPPLPVESGIDVIDASTNLVLAIAVAAARIGQKSDLEPQTHAGSLIFALLDIITARSIVAYQRIQPGADVDAAIERFIDDHGKTVRALYRKLIANDETMPEGTTKQ